MNKNKNKSGAFLSGFTYTSDAICKCGHGDWDHGAVLDANAEWTKDMRCHHWKCKCKEFKSKIQPKKVTKKKEVKHGRRKNRV